jgi:TP901 family phage tail tape measure protein
MAEDANARIRVDIDTAAALANIKNLQRQISTFHTSLAKSGAQATASSLQLQQSLINGINKTGQFSAGIKNIRTTTDSFTNSLQKNKLSMGEYFRYSAAATKSFGRFFSTEFDTINKVARERVKDLQTQYIKMGRDANGAMRAIAIRPLALDMENLATKTQIAAQRQALLNQMLKQGSTNLLNFGKNTQWAGRQLMVGFTVPLVMLGSVAAKTFMDMEKQAVRFKRVYGEMFTTTEETNKALQDVKNLANEFTKYGVAVSKTMELAADIAATGKMGAELTAQVAQTTRLAVLGGVEQSEALEATISLTDAFGVSAEDLAGKIDFLNAVENQTITSIEDLTIAIPKAGPVVQQLGGDVEDLTFFLTAMREGGINASEGANALKSGLAALINPTGKASEMLKEFGINITGIVEANAGDVKGLVVDFATALDGLDPLDRARAIEQLFGKFQFSRLSTLFANVIKDGNQASRVLKLTNATTAELAVLSERELKRVEDSPMFKFQKALEDIKVTLVPLGEAFLKAVTPLLEFGTSVLKKFNELDEGAKGFVVGLTAIAGVIGPVFLMGFGLIANGVANVIKGFVFFKTALNKAGSASTQLGMQTDYMTQQQLEAAAVAASLDQVHTKLKQTFTSEAAAINALTAAYERAILKQAAFAGTPMAVGRGAKGRKGYASGVLSVPGPKGAGDIVPAMLAPGEAVIPADQAEKYRGFIEALISGNIPGFKKGESKVSSGSGLPKGFVKGYTDSVMFLPKDINTDMKGGPISSSRLADSIKANPAGVQGPLAGAIANNLAPGKSVEDTIKNNPNIKKFSESLSNNIATRVAKVGPMITEPQFQKIVQQEENKLAKKYGKVYQDTIREQRKVRSYENRQVRRIQSDGKSTPVGRQALYDPKQTGIRHYASDAISKRSTAAAMAMDPKFNRADKVQAHTTAPRQLNMKVMERASKVFNKVLSSPFLNSLRLQEQGKIQVATGRGEQRITLPASSTPEEQRAAKEKALAGKKAAVVEDKAKKQSVDATKKETKAKEANTKAVAKETKARVNAATPAGPTQKQKITARETKSGTRFYSGNRLASDQKAAQTTYNRQQGAIRGAETRRANAAAAANQGPASQQRGMGGGRAGMVGMVASGAVMGGSMLPGAAGKVAQDLMMPIMALSMILPMLPGPVALAVAAVSGLALAAFALKGAFDKAQKEAMELTETLGAGKKAILSYAEFAGTASAGEIMDKQRSDAASPFSVQQGKTTFGESFVTGEQGKAMLDSLRKSVSTVGSSATQAQLTNQLGTAVASGALDEAQARSIAASIGKELGDQSFGINVNAKLIEIFGPNGENLINEPLEIRVRMIQETQNQVGALADVSGAQMAAGNANVVGGAVKSIAGTGLAIAGTMAAVAGLAQVVPVAGQVAGAILLAGAGVVALGFGISDAVTGMAQLGATSGANVAMGMVAMQQQQEMVDSLDLEYQKRIANANAAGDVALAEELTTKHIRDREALLVKNAETTKMVLDNFANQGSFLGMNFNQGAYKDAAKKALDAAYADDPVMGQIAQGAYSQTVAASGLNDTQEYQMTLMLASKELDPMVVSQLLSSFGNDSEQMTKILNIMTNIGSADGNRAISLMNMFVDEEGKPLPEQQKDFIANIEAKTPAQAQKSLAMFEEVAKLGGANVLETSVIMQFYNKNPQAQARMENMIEQINSYGGELTMDFVQNLVGEGQFEAFKQNQAYFESLDNEQRKDYVSAFVNTMELQGDKDMQDAWRAWQKTLPADQKARAFEDFATVTAVRVTEAGIDRTAKAVEEEDTGGGGGGGGPTASPLDDLLKKLRDVRKNQIGVTKGFEASANAINKLFGDGKGINLFSGLENDMRKLGAGEDLINLIAGMDPEEFDKKKNTLFNFNKQTGEIIGFKNQLKNIGKALSAIALGEYVSQQQKQAQESKNQVLAFNQLRAAGYSTAEAYEAIQNASLSAALAAGDFTKAQIEEMLAVQRERAALMKEAARLTPEGLQEVFDEGFNKAMEAFDAKERKLTLEYEFKIANDQALIEQAQNQIAAIQYQLDDYEADLRGIEDQENAINETYDEKLDALEKVRKANQKVLDQEKGRLSVAEAITRGDLAAAAKAAQDVRATSASGYFSSQTDALNAGRRSALDAVRGDGGLSRIEIEEKVKNLTNQIFEIEENALEPATERVRLAGLELKSRIDELTELGKTKKEWELIKAQIDVSRVNSIGYKEAMEEALKVVEDVKKKWDGIESKEVVLTVKTINEGDTTPGNNGGDNNNNNNTNDSADAKAAAITAATNALTEAERALAQFDVDRKANIPALEAALQAAIKTKNVKQIERAEAALVRAKTVTVDSSDRKLYVQAVTSAQNRLASAKAMADGGPVSGPGTSRSDSIPAMLSNGEYVIRAAAAKKLGRGFLDSVNAGRPRPTLGRPAPNRPRPAMPRPVISKPIMSKPYPMPQVLPENGMSYAGGSPGFYAPGGPGRGPANKPSFNLPSMGMARPPMPQITSGPRFNVPAGDELRKQIPVAQQPSQPPANNSSSVYNYNLSVNVASQSDPNTIAQTVMSQIRSIDSQRIRGSRF